MSYRSDGNADRHRGFNLLEVVLALMVIIIGIVGIMSLFPVGQDAFRESRSRNYAQDAADQFLRYYGSKMKQNWALLDALPVCCPLPDAEANATYANGDANGIFGDVAGLGIEYLDRDNDGKYDYYLSEDTGDLCRDDTGIFKIVQRTSAQVTDFSVVLRVWRTAQTYRAYEALSGQWSSPKAVPQTAAVTLNVEVSWPAEAPYAGRQWLRTALDVVRPSAHSIDVVRGTDDWPDTDPYTVWGIKNGTSSLGYYEVHDGLEVHDEGLLSGIAEHTTNVEALTVSEGVVYFVNNDGTSQLYKILPSSLDLNAGTHVEVVAVGDTGLGGNDAITCLEVIDGNLYGLTARSKKIYLIDALTGDTTFVGDLDVPGSFSPGGLTQGADGTVYVTKEKNHNSELWKFTSFPGGELVEVCSVRGSGTLSTLTAHPDGSLYAADESTWYAIDPGSGQAETIASSTTGIEDGDFYYGFEEGQSEEEGLTSVSTAGRININPSNGPHFEFTLLKANDGGEITRDNLHDDDVRDYGNVEAVAILLKPKGNGNQNGFMVNGQVFELQNAHAYDITSTGTMTVHLYNEGNGQGAAMGRWWIEFVRADDVTVIETR